MYENINIKRVWWARRKWDCPLEKDLTLSARPTYWCLDKIAYARLVFINFVYFFCGSVAQTRWYLRYAFGRNLNVLILMHCMNFVLSEFLIIFVRVVFIFCSFNSLFSSFSSSNRYFSQNTFPLFLLLSKIHCIYLCFDLIPYHVLMIHQKFIRVCHNQRLIHICITMHLICCV